MKHYNFQPTVGITSNYRQTALQRRIGKTNLSSIKLYSEAPYLFYSMEFRYREYSTIPFTPF
jgi:hypothetical protein